MVRPIVRPRREVGERPPRPAEGGDPPRQFRIPPDAFLDRPRFLLGEFPGGQRGEVPHLPVGERPPGHGDDALRAANAAAWLRRASTSACRPRWIRDLTVPSGMSSRSAISG